MIVEKISENLAIKLIFALVFFLVTYDIDLFLIRIGGSSRTTNGLTAFKKDEFRIIVDNEDDEPLIG